MAASSAGRRVEPGRGEMSDGSQRERGGAAQHSTAEPLPGEGEGGRYRPGSPGETLTAVPATESGRRSGTRDFTCAPAPRVGGGLYMPALAESRHVSTGSPLPCTFAGSGAATSLAPGGEIGVF